MAAALSEDVYAAVLAPHGGKARIDGHYASQLQRGGVNPCYRVVGHRHEAAAVIHGKQPLPFPRGQDVLRLDYLALRHGVLVVAEQQSAVCRQHCGTSASGGRHVADKVSADVVYDALTLVAVAEELAAVGDTHRPFPVVCRDDVYRTHVALEDGVDALHAVRGVQHGGIYVLLVAVAGIGVGVVPGGVGEEAGEVDVLVYLCDGRLCEGVA